MCFIYVAKLISRVLTRTSDPLRLSGTMCKIIRGHKVAVGSRFSRGPTKRAKYRRDAMEWTRTVASGTVDRRPGIPRINLLERA